jgi:hypothetical protein
VTGTLVIPARFRGASSSGIGGYVAGTIAGRVARSCAIRGGRHRNHAARDSADGAEGRHAFREKRDPEIRGR